MVFLCACGFIYFCQEAPTGCLHKIVLVGNDTPQIVLERVTKARQALEMQLKCKGKITNLFGFLF
jgi:hypothetical protein